MRWRLRLPAFRVFAHLLVQAQIKKNQSSVSLIFVRGIHQTGEFPAQRASYMENDSIWWRPHAYAQIVMSDWICLQYLVTRPMEKGIIFHLFHIDQCCVFWWPDTEVHSAASRRIKEFVFVCWIFLCTRGTINGADGLLLNCTHSWLSWKIYGQTSNITRNLVGNKIVDQSDVIWTSLVGSAPIISSLST